MSHYVAMLRCKLIPELVEIVLDLLVKIIVIGTPLWLWMARRSFEHHLSKKLATLSQAQEARDDLIRQSIVMPDLIVEQRVQAAKHLWKSFCDFRNKRPASVLFEVDVLTLAEFEKKVQDATFCKRVKAELSLESIVMWSEQCEIEHARPFLDSNSYLHWFVYRAVVARSAFLLLESAETGRGEHWTQDANIRGMLRSCLTEREIQQLDSCQAFHIVEWTRISEARLLDSLKRSLSGNTKEDYGQVARTIAQVDRLRRNS